MTSKLSPQKLKALKLSKQSQWTLATVLSIIESNTYCPEIIQQVDSVIGLLKSARKELLIGHFHSCLSVRLRQDKEATIKELLKIYNLSD